VVLIPYDRIPNEALNGHGSSDTKLPPVTFHALFPCVDQLAIVGNFTCPNFFADPTQSFASQASQFAVMDRCAEFVERA